MDVLLHATFHVSAFTPSLHGVIILHSTSVGSLVRSISFTADFAILPSCRSLDRSHNEVHRPHAFHSAIYCISAADVPSAILFCATKFLLGIHDLVRSVGIVFQLVVLHNAINHIILSFWLSGQRVGSSSRSTPNLYLYTNSSKPDLPRMQLCQDLTFCAPSIPSLCGLNTSASSRICDGAPSTLPSAFRDSVLSDPLKSMPYEHVVLCRSSQKASESLIAYLFMNLEES